MDLFWKQFEALVTDSAHNVFFKARLKLTALYVVIVAIIIVGFSMFLYQNIGQNLKDARDDDFSGPQAHQHFVQDAIGLVGSDLILADIFILFLAAGFSFVLAGKTLEPIQRSVEAQKAFAANASHELRTPLAVMKNDIEVFFKNRTPSTETVASTMRSNMEEINHMSKLIEDLLLLARSDNEIISPHIDTDLNIVIQNVVERIKFLAETKKITLMYKKPTDTHIVQGDAASLERAVLNIIQNSIEHTPEGGLITVASLVEDAQVVIRIQDTGSGISQDDLSYVFTRFHKGDSAKGTGLGLSIVKEIISQHRGTIHIDSILGAGTTVTLRFSTV